MFKKLTEEGKEIVATITGRHQTYVDMVAERAASLLDYVETNVEYKNGRRGGEIDIYGFKNGEVYIFEVKSTDNAKHRKKAEHQLLRAERYLGKKCHKYYYAGNIDFCEEI